MLVAQLVTPLDPAVRASNVHLAVDSKTQQLTLSALAMDLPLASTENIHVDQLAQLLAIAATHQLSPRKSNAFR